jgi:hypothetical protein
MKAAIFEAPYRLVVSERPLRALQAAEVLLRVQACGVDLDGGVAERSQVHSKSLLWNRWRVS